MTPAGAKTPCQLDYFPIHPEPKATRHSEQRPPSAEGQPVNRARTNEKRRKRRKQRTKPGLQTQQEPTPGRTARIPPPTPLLAGKPIRKAVSPLPSYVPTHRQDRWNRSAWLSGLSNVRGSKRERDGDRQRGEGGGGREGGRREGGGKKMRGKEGRGQW